jgi:hypothetical protein
MRKRELPLSAFHNDGSCSMGEALAGARRSTDEPLMARHHYETRRDAERKYPHRVDIPVPEDGLGNQLNTMVEWCRQRFTEWEHHGVTSPERDAGGIAIDAVRFYFIDEVSAREFRERCSKP